MLDITNWQVEYCRAGFPDPLADGRGTGNLTKYALPCSNKILPCSNKILRFTACSCWRFSQPCIVSVLYLLGMEVQPSTFPFWIQLLFYKSNHQPTEINWVILFVWFIIFIYKSYLWDPVGSDRSPLFTITYYLLLVIIHVSGIIYNIIFY